VSQDPWIQRDPAQLLELVAATASARKLRLFACAYCRRVIHLLPSSRGLEAIEAAEKFADARLSADDLRYARNAAWLSRDDAREQEHDMAAVAATKVAELELRPQAVVHAVAAALVEGFADDARERGEQFRLMHCIFGPTPEHSVDFHPGQLPPDVLALAHRIYDTKAFDALPELAEPLQQAGAGAASAHCKEPGPHARGCWVIDGLLGRS
jgi:hypothetical protein